MESVNSAVIATVVARPVEKQLCNHFIYDNNQYDMLLDMRLKLLHHHHTHLRVLK